MKECPILFNGEMVRAILDGRKTQTRRPVKPQPTPPDGWYPDRYAQERNWTFWGPRGTPDAGRCSPLFAAPVVPGDRLWVRETWGSGDEYYGDAQTDPPMVVVYRADKSGRYADDTPLPKRDTDTFAWETQKWRPSIHMPRWASRIALKVTDVRVQRLEDITDADAVAEGFECRYPFLREFGCIYGIGNPWVWAITFRRVP